MRVVLMKKKSYNNLWSGIEPHFSIPDYFFIMAEEKK